MRKTRTEERRDERVAKIVLRAATVSLIHSIITLITPLIK